MTATTGMDRALVRIGNAGVQVAPVPPHFAASKERGDLFPQEGCSTVRRQAVVMSQQNDFLVDCVVEKAGHISALVRIELAVLIEVDLIGVIGCIESNHKPILILQREVAVQLLGTELRVCERLAEIRSEEHTSE